MQKLKITVILLLILLGQQLYAQTKKSNSQTNKSENEMNKIKSAQPVKAFFTAFGKGDFDGIINTFHPDCTLSAVKKQPRNEQELYGIYKGKEGAKVFIMNLGKLFDTQTFAVENIIGENDVAFANGSFTHKLKKTGKLFSSEWALRCRIKEGKIIDFHFYEDSAAFFEANK